MKELTAVSVSRCRKILHTMLLISAAFSAGTAQASRNPLHAIADFWRLPHLQGKISPETSDSQWKSPYFWEVSYYQFYNPEKQTGANISVFVLSPRFNPKLTVIGSIHRLGRQTEFFRQFPLSEATMDPTSADVIAGEGTDRIEILNHGSRLRFNIAEVSGDLKIDATVDTHWLESYQFPQTADLSALSPSLLFDYQLTWLPLSPRASYSGKLTPHAFGPQFDLPETPGYHDRLWGVWNPGAQPYQWISLLSHSRAGEKIEALIGYFPGLNAFGGGWVRTDDQTYFCDPAKISTEVKEHASIVPTRFNPLMDAQVRHHYTSDLHAAGNSRSDSASSPAGSGPRQEIPKRLMVTLSECRTPESESILTGIFDIQARRFDAKGLDLPANLGSLLFNDFSITDLDGSVTGFISRKVPGTPPRMTTVTGTASMQAISGKRR